jgi:hypothetical protein
VIMKKEARFEIKCLVADFGGLASLSWDDTGEARCVKCSKFSDFGCMDSLFWQVFQKFEPVNAMLLGNTSGTVLMKQKPGITGMIRQCLYK